jgi:hypothetical protein
VPVTPRAAFVGRRGITVAAGNPGLQGALTKPVFAGDVEAAETALGWIEHLHREGAPPEDVQALVEDRTAKDSDNALIAFFGRLAFRTYKDALTANELRQFSAATLFSEGVPIGGVPVRRAAIQPRGRSTRRHCRRTHPSWITPSARP